MAVDQQLKWGWETWVRDNTKKVKDTLNCQTGNITKSAKGFYIAHATEGRSNVECNATNNTCESFFPGRRFIPVYYDEKEPTLVMYQCLDLTFAINELEKSSAMSKLDSKWKGIIAQAKKFSEKIHYSFMMVLSQNPDKLSKDAKKKVDTFISSFNDQVPNFKISDKLFDLAARAIGWDGKKVYNVLSDVFKPDQSKSTCKY
ncbi:hypothetical protein FGO68_gene10170 [Halteria grandinella]|uniref:Uncharacterized protein n=1 Tax=Halteria grandinella TaxID=5974 RepID=A0A8J8SZE1_HALGN|nr:hypothetical protein FGO68_gene10170 [Halteria grandinella]